MRNKQYKADKAQKLKLERKSMRNLLKVTVVFAVMAAAPVLAAAQQATPADVESIDAIMLAVYDVISGDTGVARDWERFHSLFAAGATLSPVVQTETGKYERRIMTPERYVQQSGVSLERNGFHEVEIHRVTEEFGQIAHAFSTYESRRTREDAEPFARGINSFQLLNDGTRWWIVSIYWQSEGPNNPISAKHGG